MKKSQNMLPVWLRKMVSAQHNAQVAVAGKWPNNTVHLQKRV
jgi:hypothetical protein